MTDTIGGQPLCPDCGKPLELEVSTAGKWKRKINKDGSIHKVINYSHGIPHGSTYLVCRCGFSYNSELALSLDNPDTSLDEWIREHYNEINNWVRR